ncbi:MAG: aminopeptidase [bacterium]|nr:aminopeptidase [bacterium]
MKVDGILNYSLNIKPGEKIFIFADDKSKDYCNLLCDKIVGMGAIPFVLWNDFTFNESLINYKNDKVLRELYTMYEPMIDLCDVAIMLDNNLETYCEHGISSDDLLNFKNKYYLKIFKKIMNFKRWVYLRYPQKELAELYGLSYEDHVKLLEDVSNFDYSSLSKSATLLKNKLDTTNKIRVVQGLTNVEFSKSGISSEVCCGKLNLPDGEVFTAPEKHSMNGIINFNVDSFFRGNVYKNIIVEVKDGKIINSSCNISEEFKKILDSDAGVRYFGEFAFGLNPFIKRNYNDNLFNEKMAGTVHFAVGYPHYQTDNGNESLIHWDLIVDMRDNSAIYFDDTLIQKDGIFVIDELQDLNFNKSKNKTKKLTL